MARLVLLLLVCLASTFAVPNLESLAHLGRTIPVHIPTQSVDSNDTFEVPSWLGAFYATVNASAEWVLPLTIGNGGQTYPGEFLFIRNYGPADITLVPRTPETIGGASSYTVQAGSTLQILSGYPSWVVVNLPNFSDQNVTAGNLEVESDAYFDGDVYYHNEGPLDMGSLQYIYTFYGTRPGPESSFTVEIGAELYNPPNFTSRVNADCVNIGLRAGAANTAFNVVNIGPNAGRYNTGNVNINLGNSAGVNNTGTSTICIGDNAGARNSGNEVINLGTRAGQYGGNDYVINIGHQAGNMETAFDTINMGRDAGYYCKGFNVNNIGRRAGRFNFGTDVNNMGIDAGANNTGSYCNHLGSSAGRLNTFNYCHTNGRDSACTATNQFVLGSSTYPLHLRLPSNTGSFCMGASYDTCLNYGRIGAFELPSDQDIYSTGYSCWGPGCTSSAPTASAVGVYDSTTRVVRSCTAGAGITCSVTDGVLTVTATSGLQVQDKSDDQKRIDALEAKVAELIRLVASLQS